MATSHRYAPTPIQYAFHASPARVRGYGGAMGGGKSRAICEEALRVAIEYPGCPIVIARQSHTSIKETTRATMLNYVVPPDWIAHRKSSMGEDYIDLYNGSRIHFIGLDDPVRWYSAEIGMFIVDQVEECDQETVVKLMTRLRHPAAPRTLYSGRLGVPAKELRELLAAGKAVFGGEVPESDTELVLATVLGYELPGKAALSFNPADPSHWLLDWFIQGASQTEFGFRRDELVPKDAEFPIGDAEFFKALATQNPHLPHGYVASQLAGIPRHLRRRYLDGIWEYISGKCYFDTEALTDYQERLELPSTVGKSEGDVSGVGKRIRIVPDRGGALMVWKPPVRARQDDEGRELAAHRYVVSVDPSRGGRDGDYSGVQVLDVEEFEQVAELQVKLDPDLVAVEVFRIACIYNGALIAVETTGGYGWSVVSALEKMIGAFKGRGSKPRLYTRRIEDRIKKTFTDRLGWETQTKSRYLMLDTLEQALRERELKLYGARTLRELSTFVWAESKSGAMRPEAQGSEHDDLVVPLAIGVYLTTKLPRQLRKPKRQKHVPQFSATGY